MQVLVRPQPQPPQQINIDIASSQAHAEARAKENQAKCHSRALKIFGVIVPVIAAVSATVFLGLELSSRLRQETFNITRFNRSQYSPWYVNSKFFCPPTNAVCVDSQVEYVAKEIFKIASVAATLIADIAVEAFAAYHNARQGAHDATIEGRKLIVLNFVGGVAVMVSGLISITHNFFVGAGLSQTFGGVCLLAGIPFVDLEGNFFRRQDQRT